MPLFCQKCSFIPVLHICQGPSVAASHQKRCPWPGAGQRCPTPRGTNQSPRQSRQLRTREPQGLPTKPAPRGSAPRPVRRRRSRLLARPRLAASPTRRRGPRPVRPAPSPVSSSSAAAAAAAAEAWRVRARRRCSLALCWARLSSSTSTPTRTRWAEDRGGLWRHLRKGPARTRVRGRRPGRRCPGPARGLPTPPPRRLCAVGAAFSRSRAAPEVASGGEPFPELALPLATSVYFRAPLGVSRTPAFLSFSSPPFLVHFGCEGIEGSHSALPLPLAGKVAG